jgi:hypothetical protein
MVINPDTGSTINVNTFGNIASPNTQYTQNQSLTIPTTPNAFTPTTPTPTPTSVTPVNVIPTPPPTPNGSISIVYVDPEF